MEFRGLVSLLLALGCVVVPCVAYAKGAEVVREVEITGPTIVGFAPASAEAQRDDGAIEGFAHTQYAIEDTRACLGSKKLEFQFLFADRIVVHDGAKKTTVEISRLGQGFGALLIEPGRVGKVVYSKVGPSTLQYLMPQGAFDYWGAQDCEVLAKSRSAG